MNFIALESLCIKIKAPSGSISGLTKTLEQKDLIPISEEVAKVAIERKYFPYLVDGSDNGVRVRKFSQAITDTPLTTEKSQRFRALEEPLKKLAIISFGCSSLDMDSYSVSLPDNEILYRE